MSINNKSVGYKKNKRARKMQRKKFCFKPDGHIANKQMFQKYQPIVHSQIIKNRIQ